MPLLGQHRRLAGALPDPVLSILEGELLAVVLTGDHGGDGLLRSLVPGGGNCPGIPGGGRLSGGGSAKRSGTR
jgi:hypothetical protein